MSFNQNAMEWVPEILGTHHDMPSERYHKLPGISPSQASHFWQVTDAEAKESIQSLDPESPFLIMGSLGHQMILEPHLELPRVSCYPETYRNEKGEEKKWTMASGICKAWVEKQKLLGNIVMPRTTASGKVGYTELLAMVKALSTDEMVRPLLDPEVSPFSQFEVSVIGGLESIRCMMRTRIDLVPQEQNWLCDFKFTRDPSPEVFPNHAWDRGYHIQSAMSLDLWNDWNPSDRRTGWRLIAVGQKPPHLVVVHEMSQELIEEGRKAYLEIVPRFARCYRTGEWRGYPKQVYPMNVSKWKIKREYSPDFGDE